MYKAPICIGGIGGSGTRLFAQILNSDDSIYMGPCINDTDDNIVFTFLFKRLEVLTMKYEQLDKLFTIFRKVMMSIKLNKTEINIVKELYNNGTSQDYLYNRKHTFNELLKYSNKNLKNTTIDWGWKEPNTHMILPFLLKKYKNLKYIHIMRNGLDNAFSKNQNQLKFWTKSKPSPHNNLKYWVYVQKKIIELQQKYPKNILIIKFEEFVKNPDKYIAILADFIQKDLDVEKIKKIIKIPDTIDQFKHHSLKYFDKNDLAFLRSVGYNTN